MQRFARALLATGVVALLTVASAAAGDANGKHDRLANADVRSAPAAEQALHARAADLSANPSAAADALKNSLGTEGIVSLDPLTKTARFVGSTNSFLTTSSASPSSVATSYVTSHADALGIAPSALASLHLRTDYVSIDGTHHVSLEQVINGLQVFGNGIKVNIAKDGSVINVVGSPLGTTAGLPSVSPGISAGQAVLTSRQEVNESTAPVSAKTAGDVAQTTTFANGDTAKLVYFENVNGPALAWQILIWGQSDAWQTVIDAATGKLLYRHSIASDANGSVWTNYPGAPVGGTQQTVDLSKWLSPGATTLVGPNAHVYSDVNDNNAAGTGEEVARLCRQLQLSAHDLLEHHQLDLHHSVPLHLGQHPRPRRRPRQQLQHRRATFVDVNRAQNAVQVFYLVDNFHDHLAAAPIGFTDAAGAFDGNDALNAEPDDGRLDRRDRRHPVHPHAGPQPHRQREHVDASRRHLAADADVSLQRSSGRLAGVRWRPRCRPVRPSRTAATRQTSSTTSTRTACPTGS